MSTLHNKYDKDTLRERLEAETFDRTTVSFYRYVYLNEVDAFRDEFYEKLEAMGVLGRVYLAREGVNAQISVPQPNWQAYLDLLESYDALKGMPQKIAVEDDGKSFLKLIVRVKKNIVADGLEQDEYDVTNVGTHLDAESFNKAMDDPDTVVVDMRNYYESEVGHFKGALTPQADTFREELPMVADMLEGKEDTKVLLYCTGGIRCEKASAFLKHKGFNDVNQLHGGIIAYKRQVDAKGLENKFIGKNFVFDERLGERISDDVIANCHQCGKPCDTHTNCANDECHLLFIQCDECKEKYSGCCSGECAEVAALPIDAQRERRKGKKKELHNNHKSRVRPRLSDLRAEKES